MYLFLGKTIIAISFVIQAYVLLTNQQSIKNFETKATIWGEGFPVFVAHITLFRFMVAGLLISSILMTVTRTAFFKILALLGAIMVFGVEFNFRKNGLQLTNFELWTRACLVGSLLYLIGAEWDSESVKPEKAEVKKKKRE